MYRMKTWFSQTGKLMRKKVETAEQPFGHALRSKTHSSLRECWLVLQNVNIPHSERLFLAHEQYSMLVTKSPGVYFSPLILFLYV